MMAEVYKKGRKTRDLSRLAVVSIAFEDHSLDVR